MYYTANLKYLGIALAIILLLSPFLIRFLSSDPLEEAWIEKSSLTSVALLLQSRVPNTPFPTISAKGVLVADIDNGVVLFERSEHDRFPIASLTKMMTGTLFLESVSLSDRYLVTPAAKNTAPKVSRIPEGSLVSGMDILKLIMVESDNDIANLAAEKIGKSVNFQNDKGLDFKSSLRSAVSVMNKKAEALGMEDTHYENPIGLDDSLHYSTARDLFTLMRYIWETHRELWEYSKHSKDIVSYLPLKEKKDVHIGISNTNPLLEKFPRIVGSKTGLTNQAGEAVVLMYRVPSGRHIAIIVLKSEDRFGEAEKIIKWLEKY